MGLAVLAEKPAQAQVINGTFGFTPVGNITYTGASLDTATAINISGNETVNTVDGAIYLGRPNQFNPTSGSPYAMTLGQSVFLSGAPSTMVIPVTTNASAFGSPFLTFVTGGLTFSYRITSVTSFVGTSTPPGAALSFNTLGVLTSSGTTNQSAQLSGSFTQTSPTASVNGSFTFSSPPSVVAAVPEPGVVAMMAGLGISGSVFMARRRRK